jgi:membrane protein
MQHTRTFGLAAESAFWLFLSLVPLAAVAGLVAARTTANNWAAFAPVISSLPISTRDLVTTELFHVSRWNGGTIGLTSALAAVWLASSGIQALFEGLEIETGAVRSWGERRFRALVTCIGLSFVVATIAMLTTRVRDLLGWLGRHAPSLAFLSPWSAPIDHLEGFLASALLTFAYICGLYYVGVPSTARRRMPLVPGAAVAVALDVVMTSGYAFYVTQVANANSYGAGLAIIGLTLMWLYLLSVSVLTGAVFNHVLGLPEETASEKRKR